MTRTYFIMDLTNIRGFGAKMYPFFPGGFFRLLYYWGFRLFFLFLAYLRYGDKGQRSSIFGTCCAMCAFMICIGYVFCIKYVLFYVCYVLFMFYVLCLCYIWILYYVYVMFYVYIISYVCVMCYICVCVMNYGLGMCFV